MSELIFSPMEIEKRSFEMIEQCIKNKKFTDAEKLIVKRVIHTTADLDFADNLKFSEGVIEIAIEALKDGANIVTDTNMAMAGINKTVLGKLGGEVICYIADEDVADIALRKSTTRAMASVDKAIEDENNKIFVFGNAPTGLIRLVEKIKAGKASPCIVIAAPVGFVNVIESKEMIKTTSIPYIVADGQKGGSNVAAAIVNALLYMIRRD